MRAPPGPSSTFCSPAAGTCSARRQSCSTSPPDPGPTHTQSEPHAWVLPIHAACSIYTAAQTSSSTATATAAAAVARTSPTASNAPPSKKRAKRFSPPALHPVVRPRHPPGRRLQKLLSAASDRKVSAPKLLALAGTSSRASEVSPTGLHTSTPVSQRAFLPAAAAACPPPPPSVEPHRTATASLSTLRSLLREATS